MTVTCTVRGLLGKMRPLVEQQHQGYLPSRPVSRAIFFLMTGGRGGRIAVRLAVSARSRLVQTPDGHPSGWYRKKSRRMLLLGMRPRLPKTDRTPVLKQVC